MATYYVTKVRKHAAESGDHRHIVGVITEHGVYYSNQQVTESIAARNEWYTKVTGEKNAQIKPLQFCPASSCLHKPYLTTAPDHTTKNNLENLPEG